MSTWPTDDLTTTSLDAGTDDPSQARAELLALAQKVQTMLAAAGDSASQVVLRDASGNIAAPGSIISTKAAASGFTRIGPNFCMRTDAIVGTTLTKDTGTAVAIPSGATALLIYVAVSIASNNGVGLRYATVHGQQQAAIETSYAHGRVFVTAYEQVAISAATTLAQNDGYLILQAATPYLYFYDDAGNQGTAVYQVRGYWD